MKVIYHILLYLLRMDSVSGSLRDSEPTSPTSPGSPDPICGRALRAVAGTSPSAITHALSALTVTQELHRGISSY